jgi:hypothetical protein
VTYRQLTLLVKRGLREARKAERQFDTRLEKVEREMDRLIDRKTLVEPKSLQTLVNLWADLRKQYPIVEKAIVNAIAIASP